MKNDISILKMLMWRSGKMLKELPRNPRGLAPRMNWQNNFKNHSTNSK